jgi:group I intron endonuclease
MKDIYIIRNVINGKIYIGQSNNVEERWYKHVWDAKNRITNMPLHEDIRLYGEDKFNYTVIEQCSDEIANDREQFWIKYFNATGPNGYNVIGRGVDNPNAIFDKETLNNIINEIMYSGLSNRKIAQKYNCSDTVIWAINNGEAYKDPNLSYPLKKSNRYDKEKIKQIKYALKYELDKSMLDIAREFQIDPSQLNEINQGRIHTFSNESYPLRSGKNKNVVPAEIVDSIVHDLRFTEIAQKDIAAKYNVSMNCVSGINVGRSYFNPNLSYPLRENYKKRNISSKKTITFKEIEEIENLLSTTDITMREIASRYECGIATIQNINNGAIIKYKNPNKKYPLRDRRYKLNH